MPTHGRIIDVMSGADRRLRAHLLRLGLSSIEPFYAAVSSIRNRLFDSGLKATANLGRPTISIGNITTGGTGKTPAVRWLAERFQNAGACVGILSRGYKAQPGQLGDEQRMLECLLKDNPGPQVILEAHPDRRIAAAAALRRQPAPDLFILDDGFQHRRAQRNLDIVLVSAINPFGYGHVLPRGLLREPIRGLLRAGAIVITHADQVAPTELHKIETSIRKLRASAPIYKAAHAPHGFRASRPHGNATELKPIEAIKDHRFFAFCGLGDPTVLHTQLQSLGGEYVGHRWFADHHDYSAADVSAIIAKARDADATLLLTTEKDWVKVADRFNEQSAMQVWRLDTKLQFFDNGESLLFEQAKRIIEL